jgi:hypothetical protein
LQAPCSSVEFGHEFAVGGADVIETPPVSRPTDLCTFLETAGCGRLSICAAVTFVAGNVPFPAVTAAELTFGRMW